jgi:hypothetical protein
MITFVKYCNIFYCSLNGIETKLKETMAAAAAVVLID